jgi:hypothetical protein
MILLEFSHTHTHTDDSNDASTSFILPFSLILIFLRLLLHLVFCLDLPDEWTSGLLFFSFSAALSFSRFMQRDFCSLISSDFPQDCLLDFPQRETCSKWYLENWNWQLQDLKRQPSSLFTIGKIFAGVGDWTRVCTPNHVFDAFTAKQHWCRHEN